MNRKELISVIVPVYNVEEYLSACVDSIRKQTYQNLEILLIDDGSTDRSGQMCDEIAKTDDRIQVIHQKNGGLSAARNTGIDAAKGKVYFFVDSDDTMLDTMIEDLYRLMVEHDADIAIGGFETMEQGTVFRQVEKETVEVLSGRECFKRCCDINYIVQWNKCFKKEIFENLRYPVGKVHEDEFVACHQFASADRVVVTDKKVYLYNASRPASITNHPSSKRYLDGAQALWQRLEFLRKQGLEPTVIQDSVHYFVMNLVHYYYGCRFAEDKEKHLPEIQSLCRKVKNEYENEYRTAPWIKRLFFSAYTDHYAYHGWYEWLLSFSSKFR
ncbi:MAG: glycosyltransferase family 2 protein [Erysipelotrichaceae bacterium]|nr:glycosyltransferase family 2 protein [Erysipelotrichaceae bacterium]